MAKVGTTFHFQEVGATSASMQPRRGIASAAAPQGELHPQTHPIAPSASTSDAAPVSLNLDIAQAARVGPSAQTLQLTDRVKKVRPTRAVHWHLRLRPLSLSRSLALTFAFCFPLVHMCRSCAG
jgi:hypothetical protein